MISRFVEDIAVISNRFVQISLWLPRIISTFVRHKALSTLMVKFCFHSAVSNPTMSLCSPPLPQARLLSVSKFTLLNVSPSQLLTASDWKKPCWQVSISVTVAKFSNYCFSRYDWFEEFSLQIKEWKELNGILMEKELLPSSSKTQSLRVYVIIYWLTCSCSREYLRF